MARHWFTLAVVTSLGLMVASIAYAQTATALGSAIKGEFKKFVQNGVIEMESGGRLVYVKLGKTCRTVISGKAEPSFLAPKMFVKIPEIEANALGETKGVVKKLDVVEQDANTEIPTFYSEAAAPTLVAKKLTKEEAEKFNKYFVRGTITKITGDETDREIQIKVPNATVTAKIAPDCKIEVQSGLINFAQAGDSAEVREGSEFAQPAAAPAAKTPAAKGKAATAAGPGARYVEATWFEVTAKSPLTGKKKPGAKK